MKTKTYMKTNKKMIGSRMTRAALVLGVLLLCAQNLKACYTTLPEPCADGFTFGNCSGENPTFMDLYSTGASYYDVCADAGSHTSNTASSCNPSPQICTFTVHYDGCDGSSSDTPTSFSGYTDILSGTCSN